MNPRPPPIGIVPLALSLVALLAGCEGKAADPQAAQTPAAAPGAIDVTGDARSMIALAVADLTPQPFPVSITAPGTVRCNQDTTARVGPIIEGQIRQVLVGWGDSVQRGQVLAYLDSVAFGEAKAAHFRAQAALGVADATLKRVKLLSNDKIVATKDVLAAEADRATAQAEADAAENALHAMGLTAEDVARFSDDRDTASRVPLVAPLAGTIVDRTAVVGAWAAPPDSLFTIMDLGTLWVDAAVYEKDLSALRPGQPVTVRVVAYPDRTFPGRVSYIGDTVDESTRTTIVRTVVDNPGALLKPGMFATVDIVTRDSPDAMLLPEGAVLQGPGTRQVVVEEAGRYRLRDVQIGASSGGQVEITAGLQFGERVVTSGHNQIAAELATRAEAH